MKRTVKVVAAIATIILGVGVLTTTHVVWDGGFPPGEIRIDVRNADGRPIEGAKLRVYRGGTRESAYGYPIMNHASGTDLVSDASGRLVAVQDKGGLQFGGRYWKLFGLITVGERGGPQFDCELTAPGYQPMTFDVWALFQSPYKMYEEFPKTKRVVNGEEVELPVYEQTITMSR